MTCIERSLPPLTGFLKNRIEIPLRYQLISGHISILPAWSGRPKCFKSKKKNHVVSSWRLHASLFKFTGWPATLEEPHESAWSERYDWGRGQSAEEGNTAAGAEDHACSVPLQSASCKTPSHGENTFKHTPFSPLNNINRAQHSVSFWCISHAPLAPLFQTKCWCHVFWSEEGAWVTPRLAWYFNNNLKTHNRTSLTTAKEANRKNSRNK